MSEAGRIPPIICWIRVSIWLRPPKLIMKPTIAATIRGIIIGKPSSSSTSMISIRVVAMSDSFLTGYWRITDSHFRLGVCVAISYTGRQEYIRAAEILDGC